MNITDIWIQPSKKTGLTSEDSYIVGRGRQVFLRILGKGPSWDIMTATASEDDGRTKVFPDRARLIETAYKIGHRRNISPISKIDLKDREYILICQLYEKTHETIDEFNQSLKDFTEEFFNILDHLRGLREEARDEMIEIYESLSVDNSKEDIYLSDGVWLGSNGFVEDRGR